MASSHSFFVLLFIVIAILAIGARADTQIKQQDGAVDQPGKVVDLTKDNFHSSIKSGLWFIKFYAPWCGHCRHLAPTWEQLAEKIVQEPEISHARIAHVNCEEHADVCREYSIRGYPTLMLFRDGLKAGEYMKARNLGGLQAFVRKAVIGSKSSGTVLELTSESFAEETSSPREKHFIMFFAPWCGHCQQLKPTWGKLAEHFVGTEVFVDSVDCVSQSDICNTFEVKAYPTLFLVEGTKAYEYSGDRTLENLSSFVEEKEYLQVAPVERVFTGPAPGWLERLAANPLLLLVVILVIFLVIVALTAVGLCFCMDDEEIHPKQKLSKRERSGNVQGEADSKQEDQSSESSRTVDTNVRNRGGRQEGEANMDQ